MNITENVTKRLTKENQNIVRENKEIQFYCYSACDEKYRWCDGRFKKYASLWNNEGFNSIDELALFFNNYLIKVKDKCKEAIASADLELKVKCPYCGEELDLLDTGYDDDNECTGAFFGDWDNPLLQIECNKCEKEFIVSGIEH